MAKTSPLKNLIFNGLHSEISFALLKSLLGRNEIENLVLIQSEPELVRGFDPGKTDCLVVSHAEAVQGKYPFEPQIPLAAETLGLLKDDWFHLMKMLDRQDPSEIHGYADRMRILLNHLRHWNSILDEKKIQLFLNINYPHEVYDYAIYALCRAKGIRVLFLAQNQLDGYVQLLESVAGNDSLLAIPTGTRKLPGERLLAQFERLANDSKAPFYMQGNLESVKRDLSFAKSLGEGIGLLSRILGKISRGRLIAPSRIVRWLYFKNIYGKKTEKLFFENYRRLAKAPDFNRPFVYVPLHYQPECTTCPMGGFFVYQDLMVEILSRAVPDDVLIYVKEHPVQRLKGRDAGFYERLAKMRNVFLVPQTTDSHRLIANGLAVATVTGTAAWEAIFKNKRTLLFGDVFFKYAPGVFPVASESEARKALGEIRNKRLDPESHHDDLKSFLAICEERMIRGYINPEFASVSDISAEESVRNLSEAIQNRIMNGSD